MKPTIKSLVRWIAASASFAFSLLLLAASVNLQTHGGDGGHNYTLNCGDDSVLVGISGTKGDWLDSLEARCARLSSGGLTGDVFTTQKVGGTGPNSFSVTCPANCAVRGISGEFGWYVNNLSLQCEPLGATGVTSTIRAAGSSPGDHSFALELCPNGKPARGFRVKADSYIDRAGLICHAGTPPSDTPVADPCPSITREIVRLRSELENRKRALEDRGGSRPIRRPAEVRRLEREYRERISAKQREYDRCLVRHGRFPDVAATLKGTATITTSKKEAPGPYGGEIDISLTFLRFDHTRFDVTAFPPIVSDPYPIPVPPGTSTTTVTLVEVDSTSVDRSTGSMNVTLTLHFHHSAFGDGNGFDSDLPLTLSTDNNDPAGSPINQTTGQVTLGGTGTFEGGFLGGSTGTVVMTGTLSALP